MRGNRALSMAATCGRLAIAGLVLLPLAGCAGVGLTLFGAGTGVAMGTGVDYTLNGIAYRTFTAPIKDVRLATLRGLDRMGMKVRKDQATKEGWAIQATAQQREIGIELERVTGATTRMRVVIDDGVFFKDRSTESEVIYQTADALDHLDSKRSVARLSNRD